MSRSTMTGAAVVTGTFDADDDDAVVAEASAATPTRNVLADSPPARTRPAPATWLRLRLPAVVRLVLFA